MVNADDDRWHGASAWLRNQPLMGGRITIYISHGCNVPANRISLSDGTRVASQRESADQDDRPGYEQGAMLPREPWRPLTGKEAERLVVTDEPTSSGRCPKSANSGNRRALFVVSISTRQPACG